MRSVFPAILVVLTLVGIVFLLTWKKPEQETAVPARNVTMVDGIQIIEIQAKGGYLPRNSIAQADIPTILRFNTNGTFDCSSSVLIPSMNISKNLTPSGSTDLDLGNPKIGTLYGTCGMGMYPFTIVFEG